MAFDPWSNEDEEWARYNYPPAREPEKTPQQLADEMRQRMNETGTNPNQQREPAYGLTYWRDQGVGEGDIFDLATGQVKPGWRRTANGYERDAPPPEPNKWTGGPSAVDYNPMPPSRMPLSNLNETYPQFDAPEFQAPPPFSYDPFAYEEFAAPTLQEAQSEPGFEFALNQGIKAYENSKAYLGTYRTGGTIKGLNDYARNMANTNYNDVFRRKGETYDRNRGNAFQNWGANRENAADSYAMNYGISRDVFDRNYTGAKDEYQPKARAAELQFGREWDQYAYEGDDNYRRWKALVDANAT